MPRLLLVSNRLPITVKREGAQLAVSPSVGGLATGLGGPHQHSGGLWIGWPGDTSQLSHAQRAELERQLTALRTVPLYLSPSEVSHYYDGFANGVLWPLFHYMLDRLPLYTRDFESYRKVNERFADLVAGQYQPGDQIWVHDYQLALVPGMLRERLPEARIGFFLHIPFPGTGVFRTLPWREQVLRGLLGADLIGFHTLSYMRNFGNALLHTLGLAPEVDRLVYQNREIRLGAFPMGIDAASFAALADEPDVRRMAEEIRTEGGRQKIVLGIDRLDYTKGIPRRLLAIERLLEREPSLRGKLRFIQVAVPSRTKVKEYAAFRDQVNELVGRINGTYGTLTSVPVHYLFRAFSPQQLAAMYSAADVMLVTPLRDGMNLVAKEFIACRSHEDGVLVLSEFAGAASELGEAVLVNPYDVDGVAASIAHALSMGLEEQRARMSALRSRVFQYNVHRWASAFLDELSRSGRPVGTELGYTAPDELGALVDRLAAQERLVWLLDYDGTLVSFVGVPQLAAPDPGLRELLRALAASPGASVHVVSGRRRDVLEKWLGDLPIGLHAEHGLWSRLEAGAEWLRAHDASPEWKAQVREVFEQFVIRTPGAMIEEKTVSLAWHYRMADPEFGARQANELKLHLAQTFSNIPVEVLPGDKVVEVRPHGIHKGLVVDHLRARSDAPMVALGDDRTDEDLFAALPPGGVAIHVGPSSSRAAYRIPDVAAARRLLRAFLEHRTRRRA